MVRSRATVGRRPSRKTGPRLEAPRVARARGARSLGTARLARLIEIGKELRGIDSADSLLARAVDAALEELRAERGAALLVPEGASWTGDAPGAALLRVRAVRGAGPEPAVPPGLLAEAARAPLGARRPKSPKAGEVLPAASLACALREGARLRGAIYVERTRAAKPFRAADAAFLAGLADEVSLALSRAEVLSRLRQERDEARAALAGLNVGVVLLDREFRAVLANAAAAELLGRREEIPRGAEVFDLFEGLRASPGEEVIRAKWLPWGIQFRLAREARDRCPGAPRILAGAILPHPRGAAEPNAAVVILREASGAERVEELKTFFLEHLAHKLRGPLTVIHGDLPLLRDPAYRGEASGELLDELERSSGALCRLLDQFAEYTELELLALETPADAETSPIDAIVREIADTAASAGAPKGIQVSVELAPELPSVPGTREQLIRAFRQILDNAVRYCPEKGCIQVRAVASEGWVSVSVADDGPGIPPGEIEAVFRPYYRLEPECAGETFGAGLGLPIARGIIERLGGTIEIASPWGFPDRGTLVVVRLPASPERAEPGARPDALEGGGLESLWL